MKNNKRYLDSLAPHFRDELDKDIKSIIFTSSTDTGVIRNGGRNGTRYAPQAILNVLKKMNNHVDSSMPVFITEVSDKTLEENDFDKAQLLASNKISPLLEKFLHQKLLHIGGGHDHVYSLLKAIDSVNEIKNILILNVDAHCDTRVDVIHHSGTPFRDYAEETTKKVHLIQYGLHLFANSSETLTPVENISEKHISLPKARLETKNFRKLEKDFLHHLPFKLGDETLILFSLDTDAIESAVMEGVSAVNHDGIPLAFIQILIDKVKSLSGPKVFGIYEYNPLYDNLSQKGARAISSLIYHWLC